MPINFIGFIGVKSAVIADPENRSFSVLPKNKSGGIIFERVIEEDAGPFSQDCNELVISI
jgi:hypothetical protein